jgi:hypothetical protein
MADVVKRAFVGLFSCSSVHERRALLSAARQQLSTIDADLSRVS